MTRFYFILCEHTVAGLGVITDDHPTVGRKRVSVTIMGDDVELQEFTVCQDLRSTLTDEQCLGTLRNLTGLRDRYASLLHLSKRDSVHRAQLTANHSLLYHGLLRVPQTATGR